MTCEYMVVLRLQHVSDRKRKPALRSRIHGRGTVVCYLVTQLVFTVLIIMYHAIMSATVFPRGEIKVKGKCAGLISRLKTYHLILQFNPSLDLFFRVPFQSHGEHTVLQPFCRIKLIVHIDITVLPGTHFHLSQVKHLRVKCLDEGHHIETMSQD